MGDPANGASATVQIAATAMASGPAVSTATVTSNVPDAFQCNNTATVNGMIVE